MLYLCVAAGMGLWFRAWLRRQQRAMDERLARMETQQDQLARLGERLQGVCRSLEGVFTRVARETDGAEIAPSRPTSASRARADHFRAAVAPERGTGSAPAGQVGTRGDDAYGRARDLLRQGMPPAEVARRVGLGIAEVNVLRRMQG